MSCGTIQAESAAWQVGDPHAGEVEVTLEDLYHVPSGRCARRGVCAMYGIEGV